MAHYDTFPSDKEADKSNKTLDDWRDDAIDDMDCVVRNINDAVSQLSEMIKENSTGKFAGKVKHGIDMALVKQLNDIGGIVATKVKALRDESLGIFGNIGNKIAGKPVKAVASVSNKSEGPMEVAMRLLSKSK